MESDGPSIQAIKSARTTMVYSEVSAISEFDLKNVKSVIFVAFHHMICAKRTDSILQPRIAAGPDLRRDQSVPMTARIVRSARQLEPVSPVLSAFSRYMRSLHKARCRCCTLLTCTVAQISDSTLKAVNRRG